MTMKEWYKKQIKRLDIDFKHCKTNSDKNWNRQARNNYQKLLGNIE